MGVNHLGHHLLTTRLYDLLARYNRATLHYCTAGFIILYLRFYGILFITWLASQNKAYISHKEWTFRRS